MNKPERHTNCTSETDVGGIGGAWLFAGDWVNFDSGAANYSCHIDTRVWISDLDGNGHINCEEEILQVKDYYPFGMPHDLPEEVNLPSLPYRDADPFTYNNKEYEDRVTRMHDYHARWYDAALGRWSVVDPLAERAPAWTPYRYGFNNPLIYIDPDGLFETRAEAKEYRKEHDIKGRIQKDSDGLFAINDRKNNASYFKDSSLDGLDNVIGRGDDGVIKSVLVTPEESNSTAGVGMTLDGIGGFGQGMVQSGGSFRVTNGAYNGNQLSPRHYQSGWQGGSRARITTYQLGTAGKLVGRAGTAGTLIVGGVDILSNARSEGGFGTYTQQATGRTAGSLLGGYGGAAGGAAIGAWFGGFGAIPGGIIGGLLGGYGGSKAGEETVKYIQDKP